MSGNNFLIFGSVSSGRNYIVCDARSLLVSHIHATDDFEIWLLRAIYRDENLLVFFFGKKKNKKKNQKKTRLFLAVRKKFLSYAPWSTMPVAASSVNHACPFKYCTHESKIEHIPIYTSRGEKLKTTKKKKKNETKKR